jgi:hypothetical protein
MSKPTWTRTIIAKRYIGELNRSGTVTVEIDLDSIFKQLGKKAIFSKGKRSRALAGAIKVTAHSIETVMPS